MTNPTGKCAVCGGTEKEHEQARHMFTNQPGQLMTQEEYDKIQPPPQQMSVPSQGGPLGRLIEVLVSKKLLTLEDALYVAELGPRPDFSKYQEAGFPQW